MSVLSLKTSIFLLVSSTSLFAAEKTPEEKRHEALYNWRVSVSWERLSPADKIAKADEYVAKHTEAWNQYQVDQLAVMTAACPTSTDCVTADEKNLLAAQVRIAVGHRYKQNFYFINTIESEQF